MNLSNQNPGQSKTSAAIESEAALKPREVKLKAEPQLACGYCQQPLRGEYWQIAKRRSCATCRALVEQELAAAHSSRRLFAALRLGALAASVGTFTLLALSNVLGQKVAIVALAIGFLVGKAVRRGAGGFGGRRYQVLAVVLTYSAIAISTLPALAAARLAHASASVGVAAHGLGSILSNWLGLIALAYASPFPRSSQSLLGGLVIGAGLFEAWRLTRGVPLQVLGPYPLDESPNESA